MKVNFLVVELTKNTGQTTTLEGGEGGSGDEAIAKKGHQFQRTMTKSNG